MGQPVTYTCTLKIAPILTLERFNDPALDAPTVAVRGGRPSSSYLAKRLSRCSSTTTRAVRLGVVDNLWRWDWTDGPWVVAHATVAAPPSWLKRGTRASFGFAVLHRRELNISGTQADVIARAIMQEVSVLSPATTPAEPCAEVLSVPSDRDKAHHQSRRAAGHPVRRPRTPRRRSRGSSSRQHHPLEHRPGAGRPVTARVPGIRRRPPIYVGPPKIDDAEDSDTKSAMAIRAVTWVSGKCPACGAEPEVTPLIPRSASRSSASSTTPTAPSPNCSTRAGREHSEENPCR